MPVPSHDPYAALRFPSYRRYLSGNFLHIFAREMLAVAVTWQIYEWTGSATALGLMGFLYAVPLLLLTLPAGQLADRVNRKWILCASLLIYGGLTGLLSIITFFPHLVPDGPLIWGANDILPHLLAAPGPGYSRNPGRQRRHPSAGSVLRTTGRSRSAAL